MARASVRGGWLCARPQDPAGAQSALQHPLCPQGAGGRPILYQVVAQHGYSAQGPEDLDLQPGDIVDVLCEGWAAGCPSHRLLGPPQAHGLQGRHCLTP